MGALLASWERLDEAVGLRKKRPRFGMSTEAIKVSARSRKCWVTKDDVGYDIAMGKNRVPGRRGCSNCSLA